ncbi:MAG: hypothetical protein YK1312THETA_2150001 [Marine Group I thaumarchaeote]|nr:MAG: hypothetical protein YK1312THETA_2150001 [Marine Group I thaumarchaeote]
MLYKLQSIQNDIESLKENSQNFDATKIGSQTFNFRTVGESILEIQNTQSIDEDKEIISTVLDYLISEYEVVFNEYKIQIEEYGGDNSVGMKQKLIMNRMIQNFIDFKNADEDYNKLVSNNELIKSEIKLVQNEAKFQAYINKIAIKIVDAHNGNKVQKIYHEVALQKIAEEENWMLVAPAMDRIITQFSNPEIKQHLEMYKEKVLYSIENLEKSQEKQPEVLTLTNDASIKGTLFDIIFSENNEILTPSIISAQLKDEIQSIIADSQKIVEDENTRIETFVELQRLDSQEEDEQDSIRKKIIASQSEPEPEPELGNSQGNANDSGQSNANGKGNDNGNGKGKK